MFVDQNVLNSLNICRVRNTDDFKKWRERIQIREDNNLLALFSRACSSNLGFAMCRQIVCMPTNNRDELENRLEFITFALASKNKGLVQSLNDNIKQLSDLGVSNNN